MSLPDIPRAALSPPARALAASALELTRRLTWRTLHPADRARFLEARCPPALSRLAYVSEDGVRGEIEVGEPRAGGSGEPVLLAHALGLDPLAYRYGVASLASSLVRRGFRVYLLRHRGDRGVHVPSGRAVDFDAILEQDVPAALDAVRDHSGFERVHWVGHALGGQLGLVAAARDEAVASVVALSAPVRFDRPRSEVRTLAVLTRLLPDGIALPGHLVTRAALPTLGQESWMGEAPGQRVRGALEFGSAPVAGGLADQLSTWIREGRLTSRAGVVDYLSTFGRACVPLLVGYGRASSVAGERHTVGAIAPWGHDDALAFGVEGRSADLMFGEDAAAQVGDWLEDRRRLAWGSAFVTSQSA